MRRVLLLLATTAAAAPPRPAGQREPETITILAYVTPEKAPLHEAFVRSVLRQARAGWLYDLRVGLTSSGLADPGHMGDATYRAAMHGRQRYYADALKALPDGRRIVVSDVDVVALRPLSELFRYVTTPKTFVTMCNGACATPEKIVALKRGIPFNMGFVAFKNSPATRDLYEKIAASPHWSNQRVLNGLLCPMYNKSDAPLDPRFFPEHVGAFGRTPRITTSTVVYHALATSKDVAGKLRNMHDALTRAAGLVAARRRPGTRLRRLRRG